MTFEKKPERVDVVYVLLIDPLSERILTVQNENNIWTLPGGKKEPDETLEEAAIREAKEETGLDVSVNGIIQVRERHVVDHVLFFTFAGQILGGTLSKGDGKEILQVKWMSQNEVHEKMPWLRNTNLFQPIQARYQVD